MYMQIAELSPTAWCPAPSYYIDCDTEPRSAAPNRWNRDTFSYPGVPYAQTLDRADRFTLFAEFQPLVQRLIRQYGDEPELREDLVGEIYCRFCAVLDAYDPARGVPLRPYLVHQLANSVYIFVRQQWRRHRREVSLEIDTLLRTLSRSEDVSAQWADALALQIVQDGLPGAISRLSLRQRRVVVWRYYEQRSFEEIAERLGVRLATARSTLRHALKNMRRNLVAENLSYD
jgi:RNA polymerase sigma factor (sigma-70 family)